MPFRTTEEAFSSLHADPVWPTADRNTMRDPKNLSERSVSNNSVVAMTALRALILTESSTERSEPREDFRIAFSDGRKWDVCIYSSAITNAVRVCFDRMRIQIADLTNADSCNPEIQLIIKQGS